RRRHTRCYRDWSSDVCSSDLAWHLKEARGLSDDRAKRVIFNAITKSEIQKAFLNPHKIDIDRVNAQQARRILDRIVGYEISPLRSEERRGGKERRCRLARRQV